MVTKLKNLIKRYISGRFERFVIFFGGKDMKPIKFKHWNKDLQPSKRKYSSNVKEVKSLPIFTNGEQCVSCWKMSIFERIKGLITGKIWLHVLSGEDQPPVILSFDRGVGE